MSTGIRIKVDGSIIPVEPKDGKHFQLEELKEYIGGGYIEIVFISPKLYMIVDDEGKLKGFPVNLKASIAAVEVLRKGDYIVGDVLVCKRSAVE